MTFQSSKLVSNGKNHLHRFSACTTLFFAVKSSLPIVVKQIQNQTKISLFLYYSILQATKKQNINWMISRKVVEKFRISFVLFRYLTFIVHGKTSNDIEILNRRDP